MTQERLVFGVVPPKEAARQKRVRAQKAAKAAQKEGHPAEQMFGDMRLSKLLQEMAQEDGALWDSFYETRTEGRDRIYEKVFEGRVERPHLIHPSTAANCLAQAGFQALGYSQTPVAPEALRVMMIGSAAHRSMTAQMRRFLPGEEEVSLEVEGLLRGRPDFVLRSPTRQGVAWPVELKFIGEFPFSLLKREDVPDHLKPMKGVYWPRPEHYKQVLLYMWALSQKGEGVEGATVFYVNRNTGKSKEAIVPWLGPAQHDAEVLIEKVKAAKKAIERGEIPKASVESDYICKSFCRYRQHCEEGRSLAAKGVKKGRKKTPAWARKDIEKKRQAEEKLMEEMGYKKTELPGFESLVSESEERTEAGKKEEPGQADNGDQKELPQAKVIFDQSEAKKPPELEKPRVYDLTQEVDLEIACGTCRTPLVETCRLVEDRPRKPRLLIEQKCPHHGVTHVWEKSVPKTQVVYPAKKG